MSRPARRQRTVVNAVANTAAAASGITVHTGQLNSLKRPKMPPAANNSAPAALDAPVRTVPDATVPRDHRTTT